MATVPAGLMEQADVDDVDLDVAEVVVRSPFTAADTVRLPAADEELRSVLKRLGGDVQRVTDKNFLVYLDAAQLLQNVHITNAMCDRRKQAEALGAGVRLKNQKHALIDVSNELMLSKLHDGTFGQQSANDPDAVDGNWATCA